MLTEYELTQTVDVKGGYSVIRLCCNQLKTSEGRINCDMMTKCHLLHVLESKHSASIYQRQHTQQEVLLSLVNKFCQTKI